MTTKKKIRSKRSEPASASQLFHPTDEDRRNGSQSEEKDSDDGRVLKWINSRAGDGQRRNKDDDSSESCDSERPLAERRNGKTKSRKKSLPRRDEDVDEVVPLELRKPSSKYQKTCRTSSASIAEEPYSKYQEARRRSSAPVADEIDARRKRKTFEPSESESEWDPECARRKRKRSRNDHGDAPRDEEPAEKRGGSQASHGPPGRAVDPKNAVANGQVRAGVADLDEVEDLRRTRSNSPPPRKARRISPPPCRESTRLSSEEDRRGKQDDQVDGKTVRVDAPSEDAPSSHTTLLSNDVAMFQKMLKASAGDTTRRTDAKIEELKKEIVTLFEEKVRRDEGMQETLLTLFGIVALSRNRSAKMSDRQKTNRDASCRTG